MSPTSHICVCVLYLCYGAEGQAGDGSSPAMGEKEHSEKARRVEENVHLNRDCKTGRDSLQITNTANE